MSMDANSISQLSWIFQQMVIGWFWVLGLILIFSIIRKLIP